MEKNANIRYSLPTRYDKAEYGSICKVVSDNDTYILYVQTSNDNEHSNWVKISEILEKTFETYSQIPQFIFCCLEVIASTKQNKPQLLKDLIDIIFINLPKQK